MSLNIYAHLLAYSCLRLFYNIIRSVLAFKYCALVVKEGGMEKLHTVIADPRPYERIKELANLVIENCYQYETHSDDVNVSHSALDPEYSLDG